MFFPQAYSFFLASSFSFSFQRARPLLTLFGIFYAIRDYLSSTEFLILLVWSCMYSAVFEICVFSLLCVLCFWELAFTGFHLLHNFMRFSRYLVFFLSDYIQRGCITTLCRRISLFSLPLVAFLFLTFVCTMSSSSLISRWLLIILVIGLSVTLADSWNMFTIWVSYIYRWYLFRYAGASHRVRFWVFASYSCVGSNISLTWQFDSRKTHHHKRITPHISKRY